VSEIFDEFTPDEQRNFLSYLLRMRAVLVEHKILDEKSRSFGSTPEEKLLPSGKS